MLVLLVFFTNIVNIMPTINRKELKKPWKASSPKKKGSWGYDTGFYSKKAWRNLRRSKLHQSPLCEECQRNNVITSATMVDHIIPRRLKPELELDWDNLQSLCDSCHNTKSAKEGRGGQNPQNQASTNR